MIMALKVKMEGRKAATRKSTPKASSGPKRTRGAAKTSAAKKSTPARKTTERKPASPFSAAQLKEHTKALEAAGKRHEKAKAEVNDAIDHVYETVNAAREAGIGMSHIERTVGIS